MPASRREMVHPTAGSQIGDTMGMDAIPFLGFFMESPHRMATAASHWLATEDMEGSGMYTDTNRFNDIGHTELASAGQLVIVSMHAGATTARLGKSWQEDMLRHPTCRDLS